MDREAFPKARPRGVPQGDRVRLASSETQQELCKESDRKKERKKKKTPRKKIVAVRGEGRGSFLLRRAESLF